MKHDFRVMSSHTCEHPGCNRNIKQNLVERKKHVPRFCYRHYIVPRGNPNRKSIMNERQRMSHAMEAAAKIARKSANG